MGVTGNIILGTLGLVVTFLVAVLARLVADDIKAWLPKITDRLVERAVKRLPGSERERFAEEWRSHVNDTPGDVSKLFVAAGLQRASRIILKETQSANSAVPIYERIVALLILLFLAPAMVTVAVVVRLAGGPGPILLRRRYTTPTGRKVVESRFRTTLPVLTESGVDELPHLLDVIGNTSFNPDGSPLRLMATIGLIFFKQRR